MSDIVEQIRKLRRNLANRLAHEAADEIERLRMANAELLAALKETVDDVEDYSQYAGGYLAENWGVAGDLERYRNIISKHEGSGE